MRVNTNSGGGSAAPSRRPQPRPSSDSRDTYYDDRGNAAVGDRSTSDSRQEYESRGGATVASQRARSDLSRIDNDVFQAFIQNPSSFKNSENPTAETFNPYAADGGAGGWASSIVKDGLAAQNVTPPPGFKVQPWMRENPQIVAAALRSSLSPEQWGILDRHFRMQDATSKLMVTAQFNRQNLESVYSSLAPDIRDIALSNLFEVLTSGGSGDGTVDPTNTDQVDKSWLQEKWDSVTGGASFVWDHTIGAFYDNYYHAQRAVAAAGGTAALPVLGVAVGTGQFGIAAGILKNGVSAWSQTDPNGFDISTLDTLGRTYGVEQVQMVKDIAQAYKDNPENPWTPLMEKYGTNNPQLESALNQFIFESERTADYSKILAGIESASNGTLGGIITRQVAGVDNSDKSLYKVASFGIEATATVVTDPFFFAGKAITMSRAARLALHTLATTGEAGNAAFKAGTALRNVSLGVDRLMEYGDVRAFWSAMGKDAQAFKAAHEAGNGRLAARYYKRMLDREERVLGRRENDLRALQTPAVETPEAVKVRQARMNAATGKRGPSTAQPLSTSTVQAMREMGIAPDVLRTTPFNDSWWLKPNATQMAERSQVTSLTHEIIANGLHTPELAADWIKSGLGLELLLQGQAAKTLPLMPRLTMAGRLFESTRRAPKVTVKSGGGVVTRRGTPVVDTILSGDLDPQQVATGLENLSMQAGREIGVSGNYKLILGRKVPVGFDVWGRDRKRGWVYAASRTDRSAAARMDKLRRMFETAPTQSLFDISGTPSAKAAKNVWSWARAAGFQRQHADAVAYAYLNGGPGARRNIVRGLFLTLAEASGVTMNDSNAALTLMSDGLEGLRKTTQYGTQFLAPAIRGQAALTGERLALAGGEVPKTETNRRLAKLLYSAASRRRDMQSQYYNLLSQIDTLKGRKRAEARIIELQEQAQVLRHNLQDNGDHLAYLIRTNGSVGRKIAESIGLEAVGDVSGTARDALGVVGNASRAASRDVRAAGGVAVSGVSDAGKAGIDYVGPARGGGRTAAKADVNAAATAGRQIVNESAAGVRDIADMASMGAADVRAAATTARGDIRAAGSLAGELTRETGAELRQAFRDLKQVQRQIQKASNLQRQRLLERQARIQARIESLQRDAGLRKWKMNNLVDDENFIRMWMESDIGSVVYDPSVVNDVSHALHVRQTTSQVRMPDYDLIQKVSARTGYMDALLGMSYTDWATSVTDWWSLATLIGFRYAIRNSIEDLIFYDLSNSSSVAGGRDFVTGKRITQAERMASGGKRGMLSHAVHMRWRPYVDDQELADALAARKAGNRDPFKQLVAKGMARGRLKVTQTQRTAAVDRYVDDLMSSEFVDTMLGHLSETAKSTLNQHSGALMDRATGLRTAKNVDKDGNVVYVVGKPTFKNLNFDSDPSGFDAWYTAINDFVEGDGALGKVAIGGLFRMSRSPKQTQSFIRAETEQRIVDLLEKNKDKPWSYAKRFSMVEGESPETFAERYMDEAITVFSGRGRLQFNEELLNRVMGLKPRYVDGKLTWESPTGELSVGMSDMVDGQRKNRLFFEDLYSMSREDRPEAILGPDYTVVPAPNMMTRAMDASWGWMGETYNRLAREPMFMARYVQQRRLLEPHERFLAAQFGEKAASQQATRMAADRAFELIYSYSDNPGNRSMLAWNMRNMARYYRATEDFYRRALRAVKNNPERVIRDAAILHMMNEDAGFIHTDDQGNKFFMYPNAMPALNRVFSALHIPVMLPQTVQFKGQFNMLTPSADPQAAIPTFSGPLLAVPISTITRVFQPFETVQGVTLGQRSLGRDLIDTVLPPAVSGFYYRLTEDDKIGRFAGNARAVALGMAAAGMLPGEGATPEELADAVDTIKTQTGSLTLLQMLIRTAVPASPAAVADVPTSDEFAASGAGGLRPEFQSLVRSFADRGSSDPYGEAYAMWIRINPKLSVFTVAQSSNKSTARVQVSGEGAQWIKANQDLLDMSPESAGYLIPKGGEFSFDALRVYRAYDVSIPKDIAQYTRDLALRTATAEYYRVRDEVQQAILDDPDNEQQYKDDWKVWKEGNGIVGDPYQYGFLQRNPQVAAALINSDTREKKLLTLDGLVYEGPNVDPDTRQPRIGLFQYIEKNKPEMFQQDPELLVMYGMVKNFKNWHAEYEKVQGNTKLAQATKAEMRSQIRTYLLQQASGNQRALEMYQSLMAPLVEERVL